MQGFWLRYDFAIAHVCVFVSVCESPEVGNRVRVCCAREKADGVVFEAGMMRCDAAGSLEVLSAPPQHGYLMT